MRLASVFLLTLPIVLSGCYLMRDGPSLKTYEVRNKYGGRKVKGTVAFRSQRTPEVKKDLKRGQELYRVHCQVCHGDKGRGQHQLSQYGLPRPPSFQLPTLQEKPPEFFVKVMTEGRGAMVSYRSRLSYKERKQVAFYIKKLQNGGDTKNAP